MAGRSAPMRLDLPSAVRPGPKRISSRGATAPTSTGSPRGSWEWCATGPQCMPPPGASLARARAARGVRGTATKPDEHAGGPGAHEVQGGGVGGRPADDHGNVELVDEALEV